MTKILHYSDLHVRKDRYIPLEQFLSIFDKIYASAEKHNCDAIVFSGDFFDNKKTPIYIYDLLLQRFLQHEKSEIPHYIGLGNHDRVSYGTTLDLFKTLEGRIKHLHICEIPNDLNINNKKIHLEHGITSGSILDNGIQSPETIVDVECRQNGSGKSEYLAIGHLHRFQRVKTHRFGFYPGSPFHLSFGEAGTKKGWLIVDLEKQKASFVVNKDYLRYEVVILRLLNQNEFKVLDGSTVNPHNIQENSVVKFVVYGSSSLIMNFKMRVAKELAGNARYITEGNFTDNLSDHEIDNITSSSSLEEDVQKYLEMIKIPEHLQKDRLLEEIYHTIEQAREA